MSILRLLRLLSFRESPTTSAIPRGIVQLIIVCLIAPMLYGCPPPNQKHNTAWYKIATAKNGLTTTAQLTLLAP
jgi:hypothetical protein